MKNLLNKIIYYFLFVSILIACNKKASEVSPQTVGTKVGNIILQTPDKSSLTNVVKQANVAEVPLDIMSKAFEKFDLATNSMIFAASATEIKSLKTGSVVLFEGHSIKKIVSVTESGGKIVVKTTKGKFTDYYKSAKIDYSTKFNWTNSVVGSARIGAENGRQAWVQQPSEANEFTYRGTISGWECELNLTPQSQGDGRRLALKLKAKKGGLSAVEFNGFISNFDIASSIQVNDGAVNTYSENHNNMSGEIGVKLAFLSMPNGDAAFELPINFMNVLVVQGGIPVSYRIKCVLKLYPSISQANSSSTADIKLTYSGSNGFSYQNNTMTPNTSIANFDPTITGDTGSASATIVGVGVGLEFPRFEIGIFDTVVVPYMLINTSCTNYFESGLPFIPGPCNRSRLTMKAVAGIDMSFLGLSYARETTLFERTKSFKKEGSKCEDSSLPDNRVESVHDLVKGIIE
jgi:hypothetical protein